MRGWPWIVALSSVGGILGSAGTFAYREGGPWNWAALSAIATFSAVLVALMPIWIERDRRLKQGRAVRAQLRTNLNLLNFRLNHWKPGGPAVSEPFSEIEMQATHDISALFAQAHLLEENEFVALQPVFFMLRGFRHASEISTEMAELLQARLTEAVAAIDKHWRILTHVRVRGRLGRSPKNHHRLLPQEADDLFDLPHRVALSLRLRPRLRSCPGWGQRAPRFR
jgi:hypothetical protein